MKISCRDYGGLKEFREGGVCIYIYIQAEKNIERALSALLRSQKRLRGWRVEIFSGPDSSNSFLEIHGKISALGSLFASY